MSHNRSDIEGYQHDETKTIQEIMEATDTYNNFEVV